MSRQRRANQRAKQAIDPQQAIQFVEEMNREANERRERCQKRVLAVLTEEACDLMVQGQFQGSQLAAEVVFIPRPRETPKAE